MGESVKIVERIYAAFTRGDVKELTALFHPRIQGRQSPLLPWGGTFQGFQGMVRHVSILIQHLDWRVDVDEYVEAGDQVVVIGASRGTVRASGKPFDVRIVQVWSLKDERVVRYEAYLDMPKMLEALGE